MDSDSAPENPVQTPPVQDIRKRMQQLLAIPDRDRTDAEWDELVEIEIRLAPGNRADAGGGVPGAPGAPRQNAGGGRPFGPQKPRHPGQKSKHFGGQGNKHRKPPPKPAQ